MNVSALLLSALLVTGQAPALEVVAPPELTGVATHLTQLDRAKLAAVTRLVGLEQVGPPITVVLAPEPSDIARQTPSWIAGFAHGADTIVLFPARTPSYPHDSMEALLHHEVAHVLIARAAPAASVPRWFHEGLALAAERAWRVTDHTRLAVAVISSKRSLEAVNAEFDGGARAAGRAYAVSGAFVRELLTRHGAGMPSRVFARLAQGDSFDQAFLAATGMALTEAERLFWRDSWWYQVIPLVTSSFAIWTGVTFLAFVARRRRAERRAALRKRWAEEDAAAISGDI